MKKVDVSRLPVEQIRLQIKAAAGEIVSARSAERRRGAELEIRGLLHELQRRRELLGSEASAIDA